MRGKENFFGDESDVDYDQTPEQLQEVIANAQQDTSFATQSSTIAGSRDVFFFADD